MLKKNTYTNKLPFQNHMSTYREDYGEKDVKITHHLANAALSVPRHPQI